MWHEILSSIFLIIGTFFVVSGAWGVLNMPNVFTRAHAAGVTETIGAFFIILSAALYFMSIVLTVKLLVLLALSFLSNSTACHAITNSAFQILKPMATRKKK